MKGGLQATSGADGAADGEEAVALSGPKMPDANGGGEVGSLSVRPDGSEWESGPGLLAGHSDGEGGQGEAVSNGCKDVGGICATGKEGADEIDDKVRWLRRWWHRAIWGSTVERPGDHCCSRSLGRRRGQR